MQKGGLPFPHPFPEAPLKLVNWLMEHAARRPDPGSQLELFS
jgi:hypothetical protein